MVFCAHASLNESTQGAQLLPFAPLITTGMTKPILSFSSGTPNTMHNYILGKPTAYLTLPTRETHRLSSSAVILYEYKGSLNPAQSWGVSFKYNLLSCLLKSMIYLSTMVTHSKEASVKILMPQVKHKMLRKYVVLHVQDVVSIFWGWGNGTFL